MNAGAAAIVFDAAGRVLVVKEDYDRRRWSLPAPPEIPQPQSLPRVS